MLALFAAALYVALNDVRIEGGPQSQFENKRDRDFLHGWKSMGDIAGAEGRDDGTEGGFPEEWKQEVQRSLEHFQAHDNISIGANGLFSAWKELRHGFFVRISNGSMYVKIILLYLHVSEIILIVITCVLSRMAIVLLDGAIGHEMKAKGIDQLCSDLGYHDLFVGMSC